jgi:hypothetical protein
VLHRPVEIAPYFGRYDGEDHSQRKAALIVRGTLYNRGLVQPLQPQVLRNGSGGRAWFEWEQARNW